MSSPKKKKKKKKPKKCSSAQFGDIECINFLLPLSKLLHGPLEVQIGKYLFLGPLRFVAELI